MPKSTPSPSTSMIDAYKGYNVRTWTYFTVRYHIIWPKLLPMLPAFQNGEEPGKSGEHGEEPEKSGEHGEEPGYMRL